MPANFLFASLNCINRIAFKKIFALFTKICSCFSVYNCIIHNVINTLYFNVSCCYILAYKYGCKTLYLL